MMEDGQGSEWDKRGWRWGQSEYNIYSNIFIYSIYIQRTVLIKNYECMSVFWCMAWI